MLPTRNSSFVSSGTSKPDTVRRTVVRDITRSCLEIIRRRNKIVVEERKALEASGFATDREEKSAEVDQHLHGAEVSTEIARATFLFIQRLRAKPDNPDSQRAGLGSFVVIRPEGECSDWLDECLYLLNCDEEIPIERNFKSATLGDIAIVSRIAPAYGEVAGKGVGDSVVLADERYCVVNLF